MDLVVWENGHYKFVKSSWEYQGDPDFLVAINLEDLRDGCSSIHPGVGVLGTQTENYKFSLNRIAELERELAGAKEHCDELKEWGEKLEQERDAYAKRLSETQTKLESERMLAAQELIPEFKEIIRLKSELSRLRAIPRPSLWFGNDYCIEQRARDIEHYESHLKEQK